MPNKQNRIDWPMAWLLVKCNLLRDFRSAGLQSRKLKTKPTPAIFLVALQFFILSLIVSAYNYVGPIRADPVTLGNEDAVGATTQGANAAPLIYNRYCLNWSWSDNRSVTPPRKTTTSPASAPDRLKINRVIFDVPTFAFLMLSLSMVMTSLTIIGEFASVVINPDDNDILGHRPLNGQTYFAGRVLSLSVFVGLISFALTLPPAVFGSLLQNSNFWFLPAFLAVGMLANLTAAGSVLMIYSLLIRTVTGQRLHDLVMYAHILFIFLIFLGFQMLPELSNYSSLYLAKGASWWLNFIPMTWFAWLTTLLVWPQAWLSYPYQIHCAVIAGLLAPLVVVLGPVRKLSLSYAEYLGRLAAEGKSKTQKRQDHNLLIALFDRLISPRERAGFYLAWNIARRDRLFKVRFYPSFSMPLAIIIVGLWQGTMGDPFITPTALSASVTYAFFVTGTMSFGIAVTLSLIPFNEQAAASWIYQAAPLDGPVNFINGVKKAFIYLFFLPMYVALYIFFALYWHSPGHAFVHTLLGFGFMLCLIQLASAQMLHEMPFSLIPQRGGPQSRLFSGLMGLMIATIFFWVFAYWAYGRGPVTVLLLGAVFIAAAWLKRYANRKMRENILWGD